MRVHSAHILTFSSVGVIGQVVSFTDTETVVSVYDNHVLVNNDGGVATVFQDIVLQSRKLLHAQRREQLFHLRQNDRGPL